MPSFAELGLAEPLLRTLAQAGFDTPFPIQAATLPDALLGCDVLGRAQTGSGKTLAFGLAMLSRLAGGHADARRPRGLVLVPTRELAIQVVDALAPFATALRLRTAAVVGGAPFKPQIDALRRGVDLLVATPGRLSDHVRQGGCELSAITVTTIDEADRMADMGFLPQVREILDRTPQDGQRLLFSATLDRDVDKLVHRYLTDPVSHSVAPPAATVPTMDHHLLLVSTEDKPDVVVELAARAGRTILFVRTKRSADRLTRRLRAAGVDAGALHGGKAQNQRNRALDAFRTGLTPVLVATDVAARGIDVDDVDLVAHVDPPADEKDYLHRAGRTARAGRTGTVVTLVTPTERRDVQAMTARAGVQPASRPVRPGDPELARITGARAPRGLPIAERPVAAGRPPQPRRARGGRRPRHAGRRAA